MPVGVSLGANALLKWLGESGESAHSLVARAAAVSAPLDLTAAGNALDQGFNRHVYTARFLSTLKTKALIKAEKFPGLLNVDAIAAATTFREFDTLVTAPLHGFVDADDYWLKVSSKPLLKFIAVPTSSSTQKMTHSCLPQHCQAPLKFQPPSHWNNPTPAATQHFRQVRFPEISTGCPAG